MRAILLELERLYNHVADIGALCNDVGHAILHAHALRIQEQLLRLNADTTGHRLLRGGVHLGGAAMRTVPDPDHLAAIAADIREIVDLALTNSLVAERFTGTAILTAEQARDLGTLGYVARASGIDTDARRDHPTGVLHDYGLDLADVLTTPVHTGGDVLARFRQRAAELDASIRPARHAGPDGLARPDRPPFHQRPPAGAPCGHLRGRHRRRLARHHRAPRRDRLRRHRLPECKIVDPSFFNWPALPVALADTIVPDFPLANKSFNLSYAGNDL